MSSCTPEASVVQCWERTPGSLVTRGKPTNCSAEYTNDCSNNFTLHDMCESTKNFKRCKHQRVQQNCGLKEPDGSLFQEPSSHEVRAGERYVPQSCSMHVHTDGRFLFLRPHQRDLLKMTVFRQRCYSADFKMQLGFLCNGELDNISSATSALQDANRASLEQRTVLQRSRALLKHDIRARPHHGWANSLVDVRDNTPLTPALEITWRPWRQLGHITETTALRGVPEDSGGALPELKAANGGLHPVSSTFHRSRVELYKKVVNFPQRCTFFVSGRPPRPLFLSAVGRGDQFRCRNARQHFGTDALVTAVGWPDWRCNCHLLRCKGAPDLRWRWA